MAMPIIFHLLQGFGLPHSFFNLFTFSLPLFFLLLSWASSTPTNTTPPPHNPPPPSSDISAAAHALRAGGYSIFSSAIIAAATAESPARWNATGTILALPDYAFSLAAPRKFNIIHRHLQLHRREPQPLRPSVSLFLYHTLSKPLTLHDLMSLTDGDELPTLHHLNRCLFLSKSSSCELSVA